jgi:tetratricopeptide (TPR) repeat protein
VLLLTAVVALAAGTVLVVRQQRVTEGQRQRADENFRLAREAVDRLHAQLSESVALREEPGLQPLRRTLLEAAGTFYQKMLDRGGGDASPQLQLDLAVARVRLADVYFHALDQRNRAEATYRDGVERLERLGDDDWLPWALNAQGEFYRLTGQADRAEAPLRRALALRERLAAADPADAPRRKAWVDALITFGVYRSEAGHWDEAGDLYRQALALREEAARQAPQDRAAQAGLAQVHNNLGGVEWSQGRHDRAEAEFRRAMTIHRQILAEDPKDREAALDLGGTYCNLGETVGKARPKEALAWYGQAIRTLEEVLPRADRKVVVHDYLYKSYLGRASILIRLRRHAEAVPDMEQALRHDDGSQRDRLEVGLASVLLVEREYSQVMTTAEAALQRPGLAPAVRFYWACNVATAALAAGQDEHLTPQRRRELEETYARRAVRILDELRASGYFRDPEALTNLKTAPGLESLHERADYKAVVSEAEKR